MDTQATGRTRGLLLAAGVLFLITFLTSIPALALFQPVLDDPAGYIAGGGDDGMIRLGALLEMVLIVANIGSAVVLFPLLRRTGEALALGFVTARVMESVFIAVGIVSVLGIVSLRTADPGAASLAVALADIKDWTFLLGPGFVVAIGNGLILGYLMYRSRLVPRRLAMLGMIGGSALLASGIAVLLGLIEPGGVAQAVATGPEFVWELSLGVYLTVRGLRRAPARRAAPAPAAVQPAG